MQSVPGLLASVVVRFLDVFPPTQLLCYENLALEQGRNFNKFLEGVRGCPARFLAFDLF